MPQACGRIGLGRLERETPDGEPGQGQGPEGGQKEHAGAERRPDRHPGGVSLPDGCKS